MFLFGVVLFGVRFNLNAKAEAAEEVFLSQSSTISLSSIVKQKQVCIEICINGPA